MMFPTQEEVEVLTGRKARRLQVVQLRIMGIPFYVNALDRPVVVHSVLEETRQPESVKPQGIEPNWGAIN
jgi:hypothetical protein